MFLVNFDYKFKSVLTFYFIQSPHQVALIRMRSKNYLFTLNKRLKRRKKPQLIGCSNIICQRQKNESSSLTEGGCCFIHVFAFHESWEDKESCFVSWVKLNWTWLSWERREKMRLRLIILSGPMTPFLTISLVTPRLQQQYLFIYFTTWLHDLLSRVALFLQYTNIFTLY